MKYKFKPEHIPLAIALIITALHFSFHNVKILKMPTSIFYMDEQITLGAYFLFTIAFLTGFLAILNYKKKLNFLNLSYIAFFFMLSLDEYFELHEKAREYINDYLDLGELSKRFFEASWIFTLLIPIALILLALIIHVLKDEDRYSRIIRLLGIFCFVAVLAFELIGGQNFEKLIYIAYTGFEEGLEMVGISLFFWSEYRNFNKKYKYQLDK